jgi:glucose/arabinose dehydrogenase
MIPNVKHLACASVVALSAAVGVAPMLKGAGPACDPDNGGLTLPSGFCAMVVADNLGAARHLAVAPNGDVYVALQRGPGASGPGQGSPGGVVALHDGDGDGRFEVKEMIESTSTTGVALRNGYLYVAHPMNIQRYKMTPGQLKPTGEPETIVTDLPPEQQHRDKGLAFDDHGSLYINVGAPSNACQQPDRRPGVKGVDPCPILEKHAGIWKFDENKLGQKQEDGTKFATGLRQMPAITWHDNAVYIVMNSRDSLDMFWPEKYTAKDNAERPAEPMYRAVQGSNFGWPYCYFDLSTKKLVLNPEYGGDGKEVGRCSQFTSPVVTFPAHWAPVDVMFYSGTLFPAKYQGGAFIAFHGSWNRAPMPQDGYNVTFQPFAAGKPSGDFEVFAKGFAGQDPLMSPNDAVARADGVAQAPDGSLYVTDSQKGRIWRVMYTSKK